MPCRAPKPSSRARSLSRHLVLLLSLALLAAACGGGGDSTDSTDQTDGEGQTDPGDAATDDGQVPVGPPTSRGPAPILDVEPLTTVGPITVVSGQTSYRGVLGQLDADRAIVPAAALPPADAPAGIAPLTGLPLDDPSVADRPAILAKIDNTSSGRPQASLSSADIVYETEIEGGTTRLVGVWHSQTPAELGPIRSGRTTDIPLIGAYDTPIFAWSGANVVHSALLRRYDMVNLMHDQGRGYFRADDRPSTYDLMVDPARLWEVADDRGEGGAAPVQFEYRDDTVGLPVSAEPVSSVRVDYGSSTVDWEWDASLGVFRRSQNGTPHVDADDMEIRAANVLVAEVKRVATGMTDTAGSSVGEQQFVGTGRGWVFTDGHVVAVTWTKPSISSVPTWTTADGVPVALMPGQTWVQLTPAEASSFE